MARQWKDLLLSLGESFLEVLGAEAEALKSDLRTSSRRLGVVAALALAAAFLFFWSVGAFGFLLFQVATLWLPGWGAALVVFGFYLLVGLILAAVTRSRWMAIEAPAETIRRRYEEHRTWWEGQLPTGEEIGEARSLPRSPLEEDGRDGDNG